MKNIVLKNGAVVSLASTNKEKKAIKKANERKDRRGVELFILSNIIMDYFCHSNNEYYLFNHSENGEGTLVKKLYNECLTQDVYMYKNLSDDIVLIANAILDKKIRKAAKLIKKADLRINLSKLMDVRLITKFGDWNLNISKLNERYI